MSSPPAPGRPSPASPPDREDPSGRSVAWALGSHDRRDPRPPGGRDPWPVPVAPNPTYPPGVSKSVFVDGMTCRACEIRIQRALLGVPGVEAATANAASGVVTIETSAVVPRDALARAVASAGEDYRLGTGARRPWLTRDRSIWRDLAISLVVVAIVAVLIEASGLTSLADRIGDAAGTGSLLVVAALGVAAGFSTCMALVGGLVLAFTARATQSARGGSTARERWRSQAAFNAGRVLGFAALGAVTGLLGSAVTLSGTGLAVAMLAAAAIMTLVSIQLSGASPRLSAGFLPTLPDVVSARLQRRANAGGRGLAAPAAIGAATYLLPCGFTQAVQIYALSTGSPARGAAIMGVFALGTAPGLLAIGGIGAGVHGVWSARFARFAAVGVLAFAVVNAGAALGILAPGWAGRDAATAPTAISANVRLAEGVQYVTTTQVADGYAPADAVVVAGVPVVWQVTSEALTCASWLRAPGLGDADGAVLTPGETSEFRFTPGEAGTLRFSCGMGMYWGSFEVIDPPT